MLSKETMEKFEAAMQLKDLKVGDQITKRQVDAVEYFLGPMLQKCRDMPLTRTEITFKNGVPEVKGPNPLGITVHMSDD